MIISQGKKSKLAPSKCRECRQHIADVVLFPGDPPNAEEEFVALTNECLSEFIGNEDTGRPQHKITGYMFIFSVDLMIFENSSNYQQIHMHGSS